MDKASGARAAKTNPSEWTAEGLRGPLEDLRSQQSRAKEGKRRRRGEARVAGISSAREDERVGGWTDGKKTTTKTNRACEASAADGELV